MECAVLKVKMKFSFSLLINTTLLNSNILHKSVSLAKIIDFPYNTDLKY